MSRNYLFEQIIYSNIWKYNHKNNKINSKKIDKYYY